MLDFQEAGDHVADNQNGENAIEVVPAEENVTQTLTLKATTERVYMVKYIFFSVCHFYLLFFSN